MAAVKVRACYAGAVNTAIMLSECCIDYQAVSNDNSKAGSTVDSAVTDNVIETVTATVTANVTATVTVAVNVKIHCCDC